MNQHRIIMQYQQHKDIGLHVPDLKEIPVLNDDVVHVHGLEPVEILGERDEVDGRALVELKEIGVVVVPLPAERGQLPLEHSVRADDLVGGSVD